MSDQPDHPSDQSAGETHGSPLELTLRERHEALERVRALLVRRERQQAVVAQIGEHALEESDLQAFMNRVVDLVRRTLQTDACQILELQPGDRRLLLRAAAGWRAGLVGSSYVSGAPDSQAGYTLEAARPVVVEDLGAEGRFSEPELVAEHGFVSGVSCIIHDGDHRYGVLAAHARARRRFTREDTDFLQAVAGVIGLAIGRLQTRLRLRAERAIVSTLARPVPLDRVLAGALDALASELGMVVVEAWWPDAGDTTLRCGLVRVSTPLDPSAVESRFSQQSFDAGVGLVGRVFAERRAAWCTDLGDPELFVRHEPAAEFGLVAGFGVPIVSGDTVRAVVTGFSTHRFFVNEALLASLETIGRTIGEVISQREIERKLVEADRHKDEFLAMLGHELRNPLSAIRHATALLSDDHGDAGSLAWTKAVLDRQTTHMVRLIDGLLDVSRIARGKIHIDPRCVDLASVCRDVWSDRAGSLAQSSLDHRVRLPDGPVWVSGDPVRLAQVVDNLLSNAVKYTEPGGSVGLTLAVEGGTAVLSVSDDGVGIAADLLPHVFDPFRQAEQDLARTQGGLGIGLALVRSLVELHGGTVEADSGGRGTGATFVVRLPTTHAPAVESAPPPDVFAPLRILLIEDDTDQGEMMQSLLERAGHRVEVVGRGSEGLEASRRHRPDVVLCDLGLPGGLSGFDVARLIREDAALTGVRLIALSGYGRREDRARCVEAGFDAHLTKPVDLDELQRVMASADGLAAR